MKVIRLSEANFAKIVEELKFSENEQQELAEALAEQESYGEVMFVCPDYIYETGVLLAADSWCLVAQSFMEAAFEFEYPQDRSEWFNIERKSRQQSTKKY